MKRFLLAGTAFFALTSTSYAADPVAYEAVDVWSGFYIGVAGGYAFKDVEVTLTDGGTDETVDFESDDFIIGAIFGRNWQSGNIVFGLDSSFNYIGLDEEDIGAEDFDLEADFLTLSRLRVGYAMDNTLLYVAGGLATTILDAEDPANAEDDDDWAFGWTVGAGVEHKFTDNWSARIEYAYFNVESDTLELPSGDVDLELEGHIIRGGVAYHF